MVEQDVQQGHRSWSNRPSINTCASTHLSEFDLFAPVNQPQKPSNIGPPLAEEDELEYVDAQTESIPGRPIAPDPPLQRRHTHEVSKSI